MKFLIANNFKVNKTTAFDLVNTVLKYSSKIDGFEVCPQYKVESEIKFMRDLAFLCNKNGLHFQVHGDSKESFENQMDFLEICDELSQLIGYTVNVVLHPLTRDTLEDSLSASNEYFTNVLNEVRRRQYNISISIENLNKSDCPSRLNIQEITPILYNHEDLFFTYDTGHVLVDRGNLISLNSNYINKLNNIHFHTYNYLMDHMIVHENDMNKEELVKLITYLKLIKYDGTIVFEYDFDMILGDRTYDEGIKDFVSSIEMIREYF